MGYPPLSRAPGPIYLASAVQFLGFTPGVSGPFGSVRWIASGFLFGEAAAKPGQYRVFLVTNQHVVAAIRQATAVDATARLVVRFNPTAGGDAKQVPVPMDKWGEDSKNDIAIKEVDATRLKQLGITNVQFFANDKMVAGRKAMADDGFGEGDGIFVLGFPLGLVEPTKRSFVIVRRGIFARVRDYLLTGKGDILIDAFVFPGNSGGPVVTDPRVFSGWRTATENACYLIGMVQSYLPYDDVAYSLQTKQPRVTFEENSGLAVVIPIDKIETDIRKEIFKE